MRPIIPRFVIVGLIALVVFSVVSAAAAGISVPNKRLADQSFGITANNLKPAACGALNLTNLVTGSGFISGTNQNDLILGSSGADFIYGGDGDDCIIGGGGDDNLVGGNGTDVCVGGPGTDGFPFGGCETQIQ